MRNSDYSVERILLISPPQNEMINRNYSRIFIAPVGEGTINSILYQAYRPIEGFVDVVAAAIAMAGLHDSSGNLSLRPQVNPSVTGGFLQEHLVSGGWLENDSKKVFDIWVEVLIRNENLPEVDMTTYSAFPVEGYQENPLVIAVDIAELTNRPQENDNDQSQGTVSETFNTSGGNLQETDNQSQETGSDDSDQVPGGQGRVKDPATDGRLKQNREQSETAMARRDDTTSASSGRMAGKPGRVRDPDLDMRIGANRRAVAQSGQQHAAAGGR